MSSVAPPTDARVAFLASLIDDAALFPPAREPMAAAVSGHLRHRRGQHGWLQGRFLCPASRLAELAGSLTAHGDEAGFPWPVGAILDGAGRAPSWQAGVEADLVAVERMTGLSHGRARVEAVEVRLPDADPGAVSACAGVVAAAAGALSDPVVAYLEAPLTDSWRCGLPVVEALAATGGPTATVVPGGLRAKLRCAGATAADVPSTGQVASFLHACVRHRVAFKATAGLHHPLRRGEPAGHGFLNVLGAAMLLAADTIEPGNLPAVLRETDPSALVLDERGLRWRDAAVDAGTIAVLRADLVAGLGSCSFGEPVDDLTELGVLPVASG